MLDEFVESLSFQSHDSQTIVSQFKERLNLDNVSLEQPNLETKRLIRCLAREANLSNRLDVVKHLRVISREGTTGK